MSNRTKLDAELADELAALLNETRGSVIKIAEKASAIRLEYLEPSKGKYDPAFPSFWKQYDLDKRFGSLANFTKYANAGTVVKKVRATTMGSEKRLPGALTALYEVSLLTDDEVHLCLENTFIRTEVTDDRANWQIPDPAQPLLTPSTTAAKIRRWRDDWRAPANPGAEKAKQLLVAEVRIDGSILELSADRNAAANTLHELECFLDELRALTSKFPALRMDARMAASLERVRKRISSLNQRPRQSDPNIKHARYITRELARLLNSQSKFLQSDARNTKLMTAVGLLDEGANRNIKVGNTSRKPADRRIGGITSSELSRAVASEFIKLRGARAFLNFLYLHGHAALLWDGKPSGVARDAEAGTALKRQHQELSYASKHLKPTATIKVEGQSFDRTEAMARVLDIENTLPEHLQSLSDDQLAVEASKCLARIV